MTCCLYAQSETKAAEEKNDEWGAWFRESMEKSKEHPIIPESRDADRQYWQTQKDELIKGYKEILQKDSKDDKEKTKDIKRRGKTVSLCYYDSKDPKAENVLEFLFYVFENDSQIEIVNAAIQKISYIALDGNTDAFNFIQDHLNDENLDERVKLELHLANILVHNDEQSINYLMEEILKCQDVETLDIHFSSPIEGTIASSFRKLPAARYKRGLEYQYVLPLKKQLIFSRAKGLQHFTVVSYYHHTNKAEIKRLEKELWTKVENKNTPKDEYIDALYGLQGLLCLEMQGLQSLYKEKGLYVDINYGKIKSYFNSFIQRHFTDEGAVYIDNGKDTRVSKEFKIYMQNRWKH